MFRLLETASITIFHSQFRVKILQKFYLFFSSEQIEQQPIQLCEEHGATVRHTARFWPLFHSVACSSFVHFLLISFLIFYSLFFRFIFSPLIKVIFALIEQFTDTTGWCLKMRQTASQRIFISSNFRGACPWNPQEARGLHLPEVFSPKQKILHKTLSSITH